MSTTTILNGVTETTQGVEDVESIKLHRAHLLVKDIIFKTTEGVRIRLTGGTYEILD